MCADASTLRSAGYNLVDGRAGAVALPPHRRTHTDCGGLWLRPPLLETASATTSHSSHRLRANESRTIIGT